MSKSNRHNTVVWAHRLGAHTGEGADRLGEQVESRLRQESPGIRFLRVPLAEAVDGRVIPHTIYDQADLIGQKIQENLGQGQVVVAGHSQGGLAGAIAVSELGPLDGRVRVCMLATPLSGHVERLAEIAGDNGVINQSQLGLPDIHLPDGYMDSLAQLEGHGLEPMVGLRGTHVAAGADGHLDPNRLHADLSRLGDFNPDITQIDIPGASHYFSRLPHAAAVGDIVLGQYASAE